MKLHAPVHDANICGRDRMNLRVLPKELDTRGFTLIELVVVIVITGILAGILVIVISGPIQGSIDTRRRAELVSIAEIALQRMTREIRLALPNSVRINNSNNCDTSIVAGGVCAIEFLRLVDGGRYRAVTLASGELDFTAATDSFDVLSQLTNAGNITTSGSAPASRSECRDGPADCLVVFNLGSLGADAYALDNVATITAASADSVTFDNSGDVPTFSFPFTSPTQRFSVVDTPVSFVCNPGNINRHDTYAIPPTQLIPPGGTSTLLVNNVTQCIFSYNPGTATRGGLATLSITLTDSNSDQSISLLQQAQVPNQP